MAGRATRLTYALAALVGVLAGTIVFLTSEPRACPAGERLTVAASPEKAVLIDGLARDFNLRRPRTCQIRVTSESSGVVAARIIARGGQAAPRVWLPSASTWVRDVVREVLTEGGAQPFELEPESLAATPLVIAFPKKYAQALGGTMSWASLLDYAQADDFWNTRSNDQRGPLVVDRTEVTYSTSGWHSLALMLAGVADEPASDGRLALTADDLAAGNPAFRQRLAALRGIEQGAGAMVTHTGEYLRTVYAGLPRAIAVEEVTVFAHNLALAGGGSTDADRALVAYHPTEGTLYSDNPFVLRADVSGDLRSTALAFEEFLLGDDDARRAFAEAGFRDPEDLSMSPERASAAGLAPEAPVRLDFPHHSEMAAVRAIWSEQLHQAVQLLIAVDTSGSMRCSARIACDSTAPRSGCDSPPHRCRIDVAKDAISEAIGRLGYDDAVGLWEFSTVSGSESSFREVVGIDARTPDHLARIEAEVRGLTTHQHTPLYATISEARRELDGYQDPGGVVPGGSEPVKAVIVLSDGVNDTTGEPRTGAEAETELNQFLGGLRASEHKVPVYTLRLGEETDPLKNEQLRRALQGIATATGGEFKDAGDVTDLGDLLDGILTQKFRRR